MRRDNKSFILWALSFVGIIILIGMLGYHMSQESEFVRKTIQFDRLLMQTLENNKEVILDGQFNIAGKVGGGGGGGGGTSPTPQPTSTVPLTMDCDVAIIGAGPGGLTMAYRLAPIYGSKLCIFDDRDHVGGKVHSIREVGSTDTRPVWTPTHAEQLRGGDGILRCMAQEVGTIMVVRGTPALFYDYTALDINATSFQCFGNQTPTGRATCNAGTSWEGVLAPNGYTGTSPYGSDLLNPCGNRDWTACSYVDEYFTLLAQNANKIIAGESYIQFFTRILGVNSARYYSDQYGFSYMNDLDARAMIDYLTYDNAYAYGHVHMNHAGPQVATWNRVAKLIVQNKSRIILKSRINSIAKDELTQLYTLTSDSSIITAQRVVLAFPPNHLSSMSGSVVEKLKVSPFVSYSKPTHACTWNAFFSTKWWKKYAATCNFGYCAQAKAFNSTPYVRANYMGWNYRDATPSPDSIDFMQYVPTPERQEGPLLRFFYEEEACRQLDLIYASGGAGGVQKELMRRVRLKLGVAIAAVGGSIPEPTEAYYSSELFGYSGLAPGAPFRATDWSAWGAEPMPGEKLCFATEGVNLLDSGWQEAAAKSAHQCLAGNVFKDKIGSTTVQALERCRANISNGANRYLDSGNKNSGNDVCLLLRNEYHIRDLANLSYCGSPQVYAYPTLASFTNTGIQPNQILWANAATTAVYDTTEKKGKVGRYL